MKRHWILVRGLVRGVGHWVDFPMKLQAAFPEDHFELLDIPGNGALFRQRSPTSVDEIVDAFRRQSTALREKKKVHILAISLGAMMATAWAHRYPDEVEQLVLINSSSAKHSKFYERLHPRNYFTMLTMLAGFVRLYTIEDMERIILEMTTNSSERREFALPIWTEESTVHPIDLPNFMRQLRAASTYSFPPEAPTATTILTCENDRFVNASCSKVLAKAWGCPIHVHPWAGHDLPLDDPEWVLNKLKTI